MAGCRATGILLVSATGSVGVSQRPVPLRVSTLEHNEVEPSRSAVWGLQKSVWSRAVRSSVNGSGALGLSDQASVDDMTGDDRLRRNRSRLSVVGLLSSGAESCGR